jgi:hypothetical protein
MPNVPEPTQANLQAEDPSLGSVLFRDFLREFNISPSTAYRKLGTPDMPTTVLYGGRRHVLRKHLHEWQERIVTSTAR